MSTSANGSPDDLSDRPDAAVPAPPETRDWTAILREPCAECGFDPESVTADDVPARIRATIPRWQDVLQRPARELAARPSAGVWSPLEYACHVADVCRTFTDRLAQIRMTPVPKLPARFGDWDQNAAQVAGRYNAQAPAVIARRYAAVADALAAAFGHVAGPEWAWEGVRGDGARFTTLALGRYLIHDLEHHLVDAG